jgi:hypothetical protein
MAVQKNFEVDQNATFTFILEYKDSNGNAVNLTGASAKMQVRDTQGGSKVAVSLTSPSGGITIDPLIGKLTFRMTPTQTNKLFYPKSAYDIMLTQDIGIKTKLLEGFLTLSRSVTI